MRLICYPTSGAAPKLVPAPIERDWMDRTNASFAYRCLPLNIANAHGWLILNGAPFVAEWDGGMGLEAVTVRPATPATARRGRQPFRLGGADLQRRRAVPHRARAGICSSPDRSTSRKTRSSR